MSDQFLQLSKYVFRNLKRHALLSSLIVISLAIGLIASFYVLSYVDFERSYDRDLANRVYRINQENLKEGEEISRSARTSPAVGAFLAESLPEVKDFSRMVLMGEVILKTDVDVVREKETLLADVAHFDQFEYTWKHGSPDKMNEPQHVVLDEGLSFILFGDEDPTGKMIEINSTNLDGTYPFTVAGVVEKAPLNSHMRPGLLISYTTLHRFVGQEIDQSWNWNNLFTYVTIDGNPDIRQLEEEANKALLKLRGTQFEQQGVTESLIFQSVADIHTDPGYVGEFTAGVDNEQLFYLSLLTTFILLMTYLNFVNLFVVRTLSTAKQMGIRSILGSSNTQLLVMNVADIALLNIIAFGAAITAIQVLNPYVIQYFDLPDASVGWLIQSPEILIACLLLSVFVSSLIPTLRFVGLNWSKSVTTKTHTASPSDIKWYSGLLGVQFFIALFFLSGLVVVYHQMWMIRGFDTGMDLENKWVVKAPFLGMDLNVKNQGQLFWSEAQNVPGIEKLVAMNEIPGTELYWRNDGVGRRPNVPVAATFTWLGVGEGYTDLFDITIVAGRAFDHTKDDFNSSLLLNEMGVKLLEFSSPEEAIGQKVFLGEHPLEVVGVVQDFHQESVKKMIEPQYFRYAPNDLNYFVIHSSGVPQEEGLKEAYAKVFPGAPFEMYNLTDHYYEQYAAEQLLARLILFLSLIALVICIVGIVGMSLQILQRRAKELIIRKIHGATELQLWQQVAAIFYKIALVSYVVSLPVAYFIFKGWMERFTVGSFPLLQFLLLPGVVLGIMVILSISLQTIKMTRQNPKQLLISE